MLLRGLYKVEFETPRRKGVGVLFAENGKLRGGSSAFAYVGSFQQHGERIAGVIKGLKSLTSMEDKVDAELNLGTQPLLPSDDDIHHVLDYRKVRTIIITECTDRHVNLLETLIGKLCKRLMDLPGVLGVRVKIAKLEIFDDCEVAIRMETGQW